MKYNLYSVRDVKTGYSAPTMDTNDQSSYRNFANACLKEGTVLHNYPEDFQLWKVAEFDTESGIVESLVSECICRATDILLKSEVKNG